ncbi:Peptidyl-tRNA hydrolase [hydrothermal vent metagenome]|uniref:peptidyl-tRNA hydrolase n=1 Tax=hydrothermal vent metagenome TaxID=652676 RepID=A0A1W1BYM7_9ZZZZ
MILFVGLGNPGSRYENNRHNIGFKVIDKLVDHFGAVDISKAAFCGQLSKSDQLLFLKPTTFMNLSGKSLQAIQKFYKIDIDDIIVIHDDLDLPFGAVRFKKGGGHGGHNGLKSIDSMIGKEYIRVRMGIGKPKYKSQVADYVLHDFDPDEEKHLKKWIEHVSKATQEILDKPLNEVKSNYSLKSIDGLTP